MGQVSDIEKVAAGGVALTLLILCVGLAHFLLPQDCYLFDTRQVGFLCDGVDFADPRPCSACQNEAMSLVAHIVFILGGLGFALPFIIVWMRHRTASRMPSPLATEESTR